MDYYSVLVANPQFKSDSGLTYSSSLELTAGEIVEVPFRNRSVIGIIEKQDSKPEFAVKEITRVLFENKLPKSSLALFEWLRKYYPAPMSAHLQLFISSNLLNIKTTENPTENETKKSSVKLPPLTDEQEAVLKEIDKSHSPSVLLHGETGSGKTRIYIELIKEVMKSGKSTILLIPEIGLTAQAISTIEKIFPGSVILIHSSLSDKGRRDSWLRILTSKKPLIIVGPRSALFMPVASLGLIIIDEAHESTYKQEQAPHYQTTRVAAKLAEINHARLILGTATPLISDYYVFQSKGLLIARMSKLAVQKPESAGQPVIEMVNLTERENFNKSNYLSDQLVNSIDASLKKQEQSLVFLNRRGTALVILCQNCGWQALCPNCDTSLTYHGDKHIMRCHSCNYSDKIPSKCPVCSSTNIIFKGVGTKAIVAELEKLFPSAKISRFDRDNKKSESLAMRYDDLVSGNIDIAVGTQIISKGLDLPKLSTIGIVLADFGLSFPDYMAEERTFESLMQVIGRVGRGHTNGRVIIQTYHPDSPAIQSAAHKKYEEFYQNQLIERQRFNFPPFVYLLKLSVKRSRPASAQAAAEKLADEIRNSVSGINVNGPAPAFHERVAGKFVWQIIIKSKSRQKLLELIKDLPANVSYDIDPNSLL